MRAAELKGVWQKLINKNSESQIARFHDDIEVDTGAPCLVFGGKNGVGKSRVLRSIADNAPESRVFLNIHSLAEQALNILKSRQDLEEMLEEYTPRSPGSDIEEAASFIIGRAYESIAWYDLEIDPADDRIAENFKWSEEDLSFPYFEVKYKGRAYSAMEMGQGEFSVHLLLWILEKFKDRKGLTFLLDEPDAFLPPIGSHKLLVRILKFCLHRDWRVFISTHSEEMIRLAREHDAFVLLQVSEDGKTTATSSAVDPSAGDSLLARPPIRHILFCEDESAYNLLSALVEEIDGPVHPETEIIWGSGSGYLGKLESALPRPPKPNINFAVVFDGDQRDKVTPSRGRPWPTLFLPTTSDPDTLFMQLGSHPTLLAESLDVPVGVLSEYLDGLEGLDAHDWVNGLGDKFGRQLVLRQLSKLWCRQNPNEVAQFDSTRRDAY